MKTKLIILGSGTSTAIPRIDGYWGRCDKRNKKNRRSRCSAIIIKGKNSVLIDTSPDIKDQFLYNKIKNISSVIYTHEHADHAIVTLVTASLEDLILSVAVFGEFLGGRKGSGERRWILNRNLVRQCLRINPLVALNQVQILSRPVNISLLGKVCNLDHQCIALPATPSIAVALPDVAGKMGSIRNGNDTAETLALSNIVVNGYRTR